MNSSEIFGIALGLSSPWYVECVEFIESGNAQSKDLHIYLNFERGFKFTDHRGDMTTAYDTVDRSWLHLNFFQHHCFLHARVPRIKSKAGDIHQVNVPWARANSGFTLLFEAYMMLLIESEMPISKVAHCINVRLARIWRVFDYWIGLAVGKDKLDEVTHIGMDETPKKRVQLYYRVCRFTAM